MALVSRTLAAVGLVGLLSLGACATQEGGPAPRPLAAASYRNTTVYDVGGQPYAAAERVRDPGPLVPARLGPPESVDGLLSSPPNDARPGECYAKVVVPGQPIAAPPPQPHAVWVQSPPRYGQASPTWCIVYEATAPQPMAWTPERYGWIRVICDKDATVDRIRHIQERLHEWGDYNGAYAGQYDEATAHAIARFQEQRHIDHGGVLSMQTIDALDAAPPPPVVAPPMIVSPIYQRPVYQPPVYQQPVYPGPFVPPPQMIQPPIYQQQIVRQPVIVQQPVVMQQPIMAPPPMMMAPQPTYTACGQPTCGAPQPCGPQACAMPAGFGPAGYGYRAPQGYGPTPYRSGFLTWPGKTTY
jgi:hypothetical protein